MDSDVIYYGFVVADTLMLGIGGTVLIVGYMVVLPASITRGWKWALLTFLVPIIGPLLLCRAFPEGLEKTRRQIFWGTVLSLGALGLLYALAPLLTQQLMDAAAAANALKAH